MKAASAFDVDGADADRPLVSLVTPAYNQAPFLVAAIESVLAQTYGAIDYVVVDDGSTDDTAAVLRSMGDRVRWESQANAGQAQTLNRSWAKARGEIIGYLSSDDLLKPEAVALAVATLADNPAAVACYCDFDLINESGALIRSVRTQPYSRQRLVGDLVCLPGPGAFFRRSAFNEIGGWNPQLRQIPDFDFWLRLSRHGDFVRIPQNLAAYRIHSESASFRPTPAQRSDEIVQAVAAYWRENDSAGPTQAHRSLAMAHLLAARSHFSAGRAAEGFTRVGQAWRLAPTRVLQPLVWRILIGGMLRRVYYAIRARRVRESPR